MDTLLLNNYGTVTIPPRLRDKLGLHEPGRSFVLVEEREDGILLKPESPLAVEGREFSLETMKRWVAEDEADMAEFLATAPKP